MIAQNYPTRMKAVRTEVGRQLGLAYDSVTGDDIRASFDAFVPRAARTITAGQSALQTMTRAYIRGVAGIEPSPVPSLAGTSEAGTMAEALTGIRPFILGAIGKGETPAGALTIGAGYIDRMADNELTRVVDAEIEGQAQHLSGWEGITYGATDECTANEGIHPFSEDMVRHPNCRCLREVVPADGQPISSAVAEPAQVDAAGPVEAWPEGDTSKAGVEDATSAWTGVHYADLREYMLTGHVREGMSLADDPIHGIDEARAAQSVATLSKLIADGPAAPPLFRGLNVDDAAFAQFSGLKSGQTLDMALSSWSADAQEAAKFAGRSSFDTSHPVVLQVSDAQGFDMSAFSFYPQEREWITHGRFSVDSVDRLGEELVVKLRQDAVWDAPRSGIR